MNLIRGLFARQPTIITTVVTGAVSLAVAYGAPIPPEAKAPLIALLVALATGFLHQTVIAPATVVDVADRAATQTAEALSTASVGAVGTITDRGAQVVTDTVDRVVGEVGGLAGRLVPKVGGRDSVEDRERGGVAGGMLTAVLAIFIFIFVALLFGACAVCFNDDDNDHNGMGPIVTRHHDRDGGDDRYGDGPENGNRGDQGRCRGNDCRGSFSPGPFDRSPIDIHDNCISPDCSGRDHSQQPTEEAR